MAQPLMGTGETVDSSQQKVPLKAFKNNILDP